MKKIVIAGGGLITNEDGEILMIFRRGIWDLPKGKKEEDETIQTCVMREVEEETGLHQLTLGNEIAVTVHEYVDTYSGNEIEKHTHWFLMKANKAEKLIPQAIEDISEVIWVKPSDLHQYLQHTYPSIIEVLKKAGYTNA